MFITTVLPPEDNFIMVFTYKMATEYQRLTSTRLITSLNNSLWTNQYRAALDWINRKFVVVDGVLDGIRGYSEYRVLAQLGFGLARAWLALAWLGLAGL